MPRSSAQISSAFPGFQSRDGNGGGGEGDHTHRCFTFGAGGRNGVDRRGVDGAKGMEVDPGEGRRGGQMVGLWKRSREEVEGGWCLGGGEGGGKANASVVGDGSQWVEGNVMWSFYCRVIGLT